MSLSNASDTSMVKIMKCLDNKSDRKTLRNLMKCSYRVNKVADKNGFSIIPEATVKLDSVDTSVLGVSLGSNWGNYKTKRHIRFANSKDLSKIMETALLFLQSKAKSIKHLFIDYLTLDEDMLEVFKKNVNFIRTITTLDLNIPGIELTTDQFLQFMKLFDNLETLSIDADLPVTCRITDEILSLVKTYVRINVLYTGFFPSTSCSITSSIFDFWIEKNTMKTIKFEGISTDIPLSTARKMMEHIINNPEYEREFNFGILKYSSDFHRELALFQKERGFTFYYLRAKRLCKVVIDNSGEKFSFEFLCPMEMSFFETMLDELQKLRVACEPFQNADLEIRRPFIIRFQEYVINLDLYYYQLIGGITPTATVQGFANDMMQEINTLEEEILVIIEKLKAEGMESDNLAEP